MNSNDIEIIRAAGLLHDIGKISIPERILQKTSKLTDEEYAIMKTHVENSTKMIRYLPDMDYVIPAVVGHHERYDGRGYPDGLKGDEIPISAQIVSVADVYDALVSERVYKKAYSHEKAMALILIGECGTFIPELVECLKDIQNELVKGVE